MAIEKDLKRIADSLEIIAAAMKSFQPGAFSTPDQPTGNGMSDDTAAIQAQINKQTAPPAPPAETTAAAPVAMTPEQLNAMLVAEFKRLGDRGPIDAVMKELGVTSVAGLTGAAQQQQLLNKIKSIQPGQAA